MDRDLAQIESLRRELADYFCEDDATFKLDECIATFSAFFESFRKAVEVRIGVEINICLHVDVYVDCSLHMCYCWHKVRFSWACEPNEKYFNRRRV